MHLRPARCSKASRMQDDSFLAVQRANRPNAESDDLANVNGGLLQHMQRLGMDGFYQTLRCGVLIHSPCILIQQG
ncbi:hypothetical protein D3C75_1220190 [compost metagenome]